MPMAIDDAFAEADELFLNRFHDFIACLRHALHIAELVVIIFKQKINDGLVYLDSAATSQKFAATLDALNVAYLENNANVHRGLYGMAERATEGYEGARKIAAKFINAPSEKNIIFTSGTTHALNLVAQGWGEQFLKEGDEIVLSALEHHSNIVPWQLIAKRKGCIIRYIIRSG